MAAQNGGKHTPARAPRATTQTIAELEQRATEIREADRDAMRQIAVLLRELAVTLPGESRLPLRFAKAAKRIDVWTSGPAAEPSSAGFVVSDLVHDGAEDAERAALQDVLAAAERVPASSRFAQSMETFAGAVRNAIDEL